MNQIYQHPQHEDTESHSVKYMRELRKALGPYGIRERARQLDIPLGPEQVAAAIDAYLTTLERQPTAWRSVKCTCGGWLSFDGNGYMCGACGALEMIEK